MSDEIWARDEVDSPCVKICLLDQKSGLCLGCGRTGEEIRLWARLSPEERRKITASLPARMAQNKPKRSGRRRSK